jgi:hypothetical protein
VECRQFRLKVTALCFKGKKEEGSSATDYVTDVTDVTDGRKREEGRRKKEEGKLFPLPTLNSKFKIKT